MAPTEATKPSSNHLPGTLRKLPPLPKGAKIQKRPLTRRQPPASSKTHIIYVSSSTSFMGVVKRARKQLDVSLRKTSAAPKNASLNSRIEALKRGGGQSGQEGTVTVMGTGRAIEKTLSVASWFQQAGDCQVELRTKTVGAIDDVVVEEDDVEDESRLRKVSCLEVLIKAK